MPYTHTLANQAPQGYKVTDPHQDYRGTNATFSAQGEPNGNWKQSKSTPHYDPKGSYTHKTTTEQLKNENIPEARTGRSSSKLPQTLADTRQEGQGLKHRTPTQDPTQRENSIMTRNPRARNISLGTTRRPPKPPSIIPLTCTLESSRRMKLRNLEDSKTVTTTTMTHGPKAPKGSTQSAVANSRTLQT